MLILLTQEGKLVTYLILGVGVRVTLVTLLAAGAKSHAAEAISHEAAQPAQVLGSLLDLEPITFIFATARARGRVGGAGVDVARSDYHSGLPASAILLPRPSLVLVLVLVLVIALRSVLVVLARPVSVAILVLRLLRAVGDKDIKEDKEYILEDALALDLVTLPPTRARLWESVGLPRRVVKPRSTSADLSFENSSFTVRVVYYSDSRMSSTFPSHMLRSRACKSFTALSWSSYERTSTLALTLFTTTVNR
jgi:hypothetical protein